MGGTEPSAAPWLASPAPSPAPGEKIQAAMLQIRPRLRKDKRGICSSAPEWKSSASDPTTSTPRRIMDLVTVKANLATGRECACCSIRDSHFPVIPHCEIPRLSRDGRAFQFASATSSLVDGSGTRY
ncbi:uncharacterized protein LOC127770934 [Oryza glaberrima]|uniref:uncharacterized protein LOC127770934 n=1 Tax=Oryza glaberrima TaxID=4538 RepID=UPI00224C1DF7|nr:uncharacterized protein LOC127770934 [Oryza glaberrima]